MKTAQEVSRDMLEASKKPYEKDLECIKGFIKVAIEEASRASERAVRFNITKLGLVTYSKLDQQNGRYWVDSSHSSMYYDLYKDLIGLGYTVSLCVPAYEYIAGGHCTFAHFYNMFTGEYDIDIFLDISWKEYKEEYYRNFSLV